MFDKTFDARGRNSRLHTELEARRRRQAVGASAALAEKRAAAQAAPRSIAAERSPSWLQAGYGKGDRALPPRSGSRRRDDRRRQRRRRRQRPGRQRRRPGRLDLGGDRRLGPGGADRRRFQRRLGQGRAARRPGRDQAPESATPGDLTLDFIDRPATSTAARRWSPPAGAPRASPPTSRPAIRRASTCT